MALNNENIFCNNPEIIRDFYDVKEATDCISYIIEKIFWDNQFGSKRSDKRFNYKRREITGSRSKLIIRKVSKKNGKVSLGILI